MNVILISRPQFANVFSRARVDQLLGPDAQQLIEVAGRTCYDSLGQGRNSVDYAEHILESGHGSVLEHASFTFLIFGVSRGLSHELVRHRAGIAISQRSTRYVDESETPYVLHPVFEKHASKKLKAEWATAEQAAKKLYKKTVAQLTKTMSKQSTLLDKGAIRKQARGAARGILGNALGTELVWTANVRALRNVIEQRASAGADAEIRRLAVVLLRIMKAELPAYFDDILRIGDGASAKYKKV